MLLLTVIALGWLAGWLLFWRVPPLRRPSGSERPSAPGGGCSLIVPARNEAANLPHLLRSLAAPTPGVDELVVVDDNSSDGTADVARGFDAVTVIEAPPPAPGWAGKPWACATGAAHTRGSRLLFVDADVVLAPDAVPALLEEHDRSGGLLSVHPYYLVGRPYQWLSAACAVMAVMGIGGASPWKAVRSRIRAAIGTCLVVHRADYERLGGHHAVRREVAEDVELARLFRRNGLPVTLRVGRDLVRGRLYPEGLRQLVEGWSKTMALGLKTTPVLATLGMLLWLVAALVSSLLPLALLIDTQPAIPIALALLLPTAFAAQFATMLRQIGDFPLVVAVLYPLAMMAFLALFVRSAITTALLRRVDWKDRSIPLQRG